MKRKETNKWADAHIEAMCGSRAFNEMPGTKEEILSGLESGKVYRELLEEIEIRYVPVGTIMGTRLLGRASKNYIAGIRRGFWVIFGDKEYTPGTIAAKNRNALR